MSTADFEARNKARLSLQASEASATAAAALAHEIQLFCTSASDLMQQGNYKDAVVFYTLALGKARASPSATAPGRSVGLDFEPLVCLTLALVASTPPLLEQALKNAQDTIGRYPNEQSAYIALADVCERRGWWDDAEAALVSALELSLGFGRVGVQRHLAGLRWRRKKREGSDGTVGLGIAPQDDGRERWLVTRPDGVEEADGTAKPLVRIELPMASVTRKELPAGRVFSTLNELP
jgi:tetratricopeptide (TPR) repeat protein